MAPIRQQRPASAQCTQAREARQRPRMREPRGRSVAPANAREDILHRLTAKRTLADAIRSEDLGILLKTAAAAQKAGVDASALAAAEAKIKMLSEMRDIAYTTCAQKLRNEYIEARRRMPDFALTGLQSKGGVWEEVMEEAKNEAEAAALAAQLQDASTEEGEFVFDELSSEDDDSDLDDLEFAERQNERLWKKLRTAKVKWEHMQGKMKDMQNKSYELLKKCQQLEKKLEEAQERVSFLEDADLVWREKLADSKKECKAKETCINQLLMCRSDTEASLAAYLKKQDVITKLAGSGRRALFKAKVRRDASLDALEVHMGRRRLEDVLCLVWKAWRGLGRPRDGQIRLGGADHSECERLLQRQQLEVEELHREILRQQAARVTVGSSMLRRAVYGPKEKQFLRILMISWIMVHPGVCSERRIAALTAELESLCAQHEQAVFRVRDLEWISAKLSMDLDTSNKRRVEEVHMTGGDLEASMSRAREREDLLVQSHEDQMRQAEVRFGAVMSEARSSHEAQVARAQAAHATEVQALRAASEEERKRHAGVEKCLRIDIEELEQRVDVLQEALKPGGASGKERPARVVPRSRGVLCAGCLTQILHRDVRQLQPSDALHGRIEQQLAHEKIDVFAGAIGAPDEHDQAHSWLYYRHKDPHGLVHELRQIASEPNLSETAAGSGDPHGWGGATTAGGVSSWGSWSRPRSAIQAQTPPLLRKGKESEAPRPQSAATTVAAARRRPRSGARSRSEALRQEVAGSRMSWQAVWS